MNLSFSYFIRVSAERSGRAQIEDNEERFEKFHKLKEAKNQPSLPFLRKKSSFWKQKLKQSVFENIILFLLWDYLFDVENYTCIFLGKERVDKQLRIVIFWE